MHRTETTWHGAFLREPKAVVANSAPVGKQAQRDTTTAPPFPEDWRVSDGDGSAKTYTIALATDDITTPGRYQPVLHF